MTRSPRWFVRGDLDGFFGLFVDNLLQLMVIALLLPAVCHIDESFVTHTILPGAAISILVGNLFYSWQARRLAIKLGRDDITALPYGINTVSLFAYIFFIMMPVAMQFPNDPKAAGEAAWRAGLMACLLGAVLEIIGAFVGDWLRRNTPRAALLSALAGIAITFIAMGFIFQLFALPAIALLPMMIILVGYASGMKLPGHVPAGLAAVLVGTAAAWIARAINPDFWSPPPVTFQAGFHFPQLVVGDAFAMLTTAAGWKYLAVIFPMALFNVIGSLQNLESAEAAGDRFETRSSLLANGIGSIAAALFGSCFPTTIYIGHPGWKKMGARTGYSALNGVVICLLCLFGAMNLVLKFVPIEATLGILLWLGVVITAQSFQEVPRSHALAVAVGLIPALAGWALLLIQTTLQKAGASLFETAPKFGSDLAIYGVFALNQGFIITSMILAAITVHLVERRFLAAAGWAAAAALLSAFGIIHAYNLTPAGLENIVGLRFDAAGAHLAAPGFVLGYAMTAVMFLGAHFWAKQIGESTVVAEEVKPEVTP